MCSSQKVRPLRKICFEIRKKTILYLFTIFLSRLHQLTFTYLHRNTKSVTLSRLGNLTFSPARRKVSNLRPITYANSAYLYATKALICLICLLNCLTCIVFTSFSNFDIQHFHEFSAKKDLFTSCVLTKNLQRYHFGYF